MIDMFSARCGEILQDMLAETVGSIIIKTDMEGFIEEASRGLDVLGLSLSEMLFKPHLADLTIAGHAAALRAFHDETVRGRTTTDRLEFPLANGSAEPAWYCLSLRPAPDEQGNICGALGLLRSVEARRSLENELAAAAMTDPATGLANGRAFQAMLAQLLARDARGALAIFEIDRFAAFKLRFGHSVADEVLWAFGSFLANMLPEDCILARLDGDRFAVLMPDCDGVVALAFAQDALATFACLAADTRRKGAGCAETRLTASAGIASFAGSLDMVMAHAERALVVARAMGGRRAEIREDRSRQESQRTGT